MSPAPQRRPSRAPSRAPVNESSVERFAIAIVLIVLGSIALAAELLGQLTGPDSDTTVIITLLLALLPVIGILILVVDLRSAPPSRAVRPPAARRSGVAPRTGPIPRVEVQPEATASDPKAVVSLE